jgi:hypothetical protein
LITEKIRNDEELFKKIMKVNKRYFRFASEEIKENEEFLLSLKNDLFYIFEFVS